MDAGEIPFVAAEDVHAPDAVALLRAYAEEIDRRAAARNTGHRSAGSTLEPAETTLVPPDGVFLVARAAGRIVGCVGLRRLEATTGEIKRMYVPPDERGRGVSRLLLAAVEAEARRRGLTVLRLDTRGDLVEAQALYRSAGYREIPRYNRNPYAEHWFEKPLGPSTEPGSDGS